VEKLSRRVVALQQLILIASKMGFSLVGLIILVYLLLGEDSGPYVVSVIKNISVFVQAISAQALIAFVIVGAFFYFGKNNLK